MRLLVPGSVLAATAAPSQGMGTTCHILLPSFLALQGQGLLIKEMDMDSEKWRHVQTTNSNSQLRPSHDDAPPPCTVANRKNRTDQPPRSHPSRRKARPLRPSPWAAITQHCRTQCVKIIGPAAVTRAAAELCGSSGSGEARRRVGRRRITGPAGGGRSPGALHLDERAVSSVLVSLPLAGEDEQPRGDGEEADNRHDDADDDGRRDRVAPRAAAAVFGWR